MYRVLVVDNDRTSLLILKTCLEKWNYQVTTVNHVSEALSMLRSNNYDLVMTEVHMPEVDGIQLLRQIDSEFKLPVILISADSSEEVMKTGLMNGAQRFLVKPIEEDGVKEIWQFMLWWKASIINSTAPMTQHDNSHHNNAGEGVSSATTGTVGDETTVRRNKKVSWTPLLHSRFVEAILFIGYQSAAPANILQIMKEPGLTRGQVGSHLQKYQKFVQGVLDGTTNIQFNRWIDLNYKSSFFSGNPDLLLINHLREERRRGRLSAHNPLRPTSPVRAPIGSSTSGQYRPLLPPSTMAEASSIRSATLLITHSESMGNIAGHSTSNTIHDLTSEMRYYNENTLTQEQNNYPGNGGLVGGAINDVIPSTNNVVPSSTAPVGDNVYSQQSMHVGGRGSGNSYYGNNFNTHQATHQLGNNSGDSSIGRSLNASQFGNTSDMNAHVQNPYGIHVAPQQLSAYPQGTTPGYGQQEQYGRPPSYGMPPQGPQVQSYGQTEATQPGYMPYQGPVSSTLSYGQLTPTQQPNPYSFGGQMQPAYPTYSSSPSVDGFNQPLRTAVVPGYPQQGVHRASGYGLHGLQQASGYSQPGAQQASGYAQAGQTGAYIQDPSSQPGHTEQADPNRATSYGAYHGAEHPSYSRAPAASNAAQPVAQRTYTQPAPNQPVNDQSVPK